VDFNFYHQFRHYSTSDLLAIEAEAQHRSEQAEARIQKIAEYGWVFFNGGLL
jgi:hypothetical protein